MDVSLYNQATLQVTGVGVGTTATIYGSNDGINYNTVLCSMQSAALTSTSTVNGTGMMYIPLGFKYLRIRLTAWTSGTMSAAITYSNVLSEPVVMVNGGNIGISYLANGISLDKYSAVASNGLSTNRLVVLGTTNLTVVKAGAGRFYGYEIYNNAASVRFVKLFNKTTAPTLGTDIPWRTIAVPAGTGRAISIPQGTSFGVGLSFATTTLAADLDTTAVTANDLIINIDYA